MDISNYICILEVDNKYLLQQLLDQAEKNEIAVSSFREEDLQNSLTAIALAPGDQSKRLCKKLNLAK